MKKFHFLLVALLLGALVTFPSCGGDEDDPGISEEDLMIEKLSKTWIASSVSLSSENVTADFDGFIVTLKSSGEYSTNSASIVRSPNPWPSSGSVDFGGTADAPNLNQLIRNDGLVMSINSDGSTLTVSFTFSDEHTDSTGGRTEVVNGSWVFDFIAN